MLKKPTRLQEKRAVKFAIELLTKFGYGYTIQVPSRELAAELTAKGCNISYVTVIAYWEALERMGYVKREMKSRIDGVVYHLNRYAFGKAINSVLAQL